MAAPLVRSSGEITVYDTMGGTGACNLPLNDGMYICALNAPDMGPSTYDVATGNPTIPMCGKTVTVEYNKKTVQCTIQDKCPGCKSGDLDLSRAVWQELTGGIGGAAGDRLKATWYEN